MVIFSPLTTAARGSGVEVGVAGAVAVSSVDSVEIPGAVWEAVSVKVEVEVWRFPPHPAVARITRNKIKHVQVLGTRQESSFVRIGTIIPVIQVVPAR